MSTLTLSTGQISPITFVPAGSRVTLSGSGSVEWTPGNPTQAANQPDWQTWALGSTAGSQDTLRPLSIRVTATGSCTVTIEVGGADKYAADAYWEEDIPYFVRDSAGNVTGLRGAGGGRIAQLQVGVPDGLDWLTDTLHGFDIYDRGFVKRPTLFFDPTATSSRGLGTFSNPYTTQAQLQAAVKGNMAGHVLGLKRGTTLQVTSNGLNLVCYGSSSDPFTICPYGDAEALPIISGHTVVSTWTLVDATSNIWKYTMGATERDVFQSGVRIKKLHPTSGAQNNSTGTTVNSDATAITALDAMGAGWSVYVSSVMYIKPIGGESPNLGQVYTTASEYAMLLQYSDVATSGYVELAGLDLRYARDSVLEVGAAAITTISSLAGIKVAGCKIGYGGVDTATSTPTGDALVIYGASDTVRMSGVHVAGNELYDCTNNSVELAGTSGALVEHNYAHEIGGNSIVELWSSNSDALIRYNYGKDPLNAKRLYTSFSGGGIWFTNYYESGGTWNNNDATNAKNANNVAVFNLIENPANVAFDARGGTGHVMAHNTLLVDHDSIYGTTSGKSHLPAGLYTNGTAATGFLTWSNNLLYYKPATQVPEGYLNPSLVNIVAGLGAANAVPVGDKNIYFVGTGYNTANWKYGATTLAKLLDGTNASWQYNLSQAGYTLDANSLAAKSGTTYGNLGGTLTVASLGIDFTTYQPLAAAAAGVTTLTGIGTRYKDGYPYTASAATIGAFVGA